MSRPGPKPTVPPPTPKRRVVDVLHGVAIADDYRWLEGDLSDPKELGRVTPEVAAWTDAQNAYTRAVLDHPPSRLAIEADLRPLLQIGAVTAPVTRANRYFFSRREGTEDQPRLFWREGPYGADRLLVDPMALDPSGLTTVEWMSPSRDGRLLAYGTFTAGDENTTLRLMEVDANQILPLEIPNKTEAPHWLPDASGFVYQNLKDPRNPYSRQVMFHRLGSDPVVDVVLLRQFTPEENAELATTWGPFGSLSEDGKWLVLGYWVDTRSTDLWIADFQAFSRTGRVERQPVSVSVAGLAFGTVVDDTLYVQTTKGAPNGRVVAMPASTPDLRTGVDVVPERPRAVIEHTAFAKDTIVVTWLQNAANVVESFRPDGASLGRLRQPGIGAAGISTSLDRTEAYLTFTSFNYPTTVFRVDLERPEADLEVWAQPPAPVAPAAMVVDQVFYPSKDGTEISMFLVRGRQTTPNDGPRPALLTGYGGFNISETPVFSPTLFPWVGAGGIYALPNLRGGGEYGDAWHQAGMLDRKQNVFDDFIAAAEWLIDRGWTNPARLAVAGGSNGGLLVGAVITERPELFRAAVIAVPLLDMLRYQHFLMARYWVPEYGSTEDPDQFGYLLAYSPYQRVQDNVRYPAVLLTAGEHDTRVHAMHARKMAARLQAATACDPAERPVLLWVDREAGHGQGKPLALRLRDAVDQRVFLTEQIGRVQKSRENR